MGEPGQQSARRYRFGVFEADADTGELRRQGLRVKVHAQPFQVLLMFLEHPGELLTRQAISSALWPDGTFVDYEQGVNSAVNRVREALGDSAASPRFIETLARRGYRFITPVQRLPESAPAPPVEAAPSPASSVPAPERRPALRRMLASPEDLPRIPYGVATALFALLQLMYLGFYVAALANLGEIGGLLSLVASSQMALRLLVATASMLIPARAFALCGTLFRAPGFAAKFLRLWWLFLPADLLWALAPFLLLNHISFGLALACTALLVYSPFAQRSLVLMGAGGRTSASNPRVAAHGQAPFRSAE